ncbi:MAG: hypothetical protein U1E73_00405 [Planctomycetota bacterium]
MTRTPFLCLFPLFALAACGGGAAGGDAGLPKEPASPAAHMLMLGTDPGAALGVVAAKAKGAADAVVVEGRIQHYTRGEFAFKLVDTALPYCGLQCKDDCMTPWDYCCESGPTIADNSLAVEVHDDKGGVIATPSLPNLRLLDTVKVKGKLAKDEHGNFTLIATGVFRAERPKLRADLDWQKQ